MRVRMPAVVKLAFRMLPFADGDLSEGAEEALAEAVEGRHLETIDLLENQCERSRTEPAIITLDHHLYSVLMRGAQRRNCSVDLLIASVLMNYLKGFVEMDRDDRLAEIDEGLRRLTNVALAEHLNPMLSSAIQRQKLPK
jgi:hypothetical protein